MDFSTMRKKLDEGAYLGLDAFQRDLELIWKNAMTYNPKDSVYYQEAKKLKALSRDIIASYSKRIDPSKLTSPEGTHVTPVTLYILHSCHYCHSIRATHSSIGFHSSNQRLWSLHLL
jgi:hypothetical protein